jgi:hypothetical protein
MVQTQIDSDSRLSSPYRPLNKTKETKGKQSIWRSPLHSKRSTPLKQMNVPVVVRPKLIQQQQQAVQS